MQFDPGMEYRPDWGFKSVPAPITNKDNRPHQFRKGMNPNSTIASLTTQGMAVNPGNKSNPGNQTGGHQGPAAGGGGGGGKDDKS